LTDCLLIDWLIDWLTEYHGFVAYEFARWASNVKIWTSYRMMALPASCCRILRQLEWSLRCFTLSLSFYVFLCILYIGPTIHVNHMLVLLMR